MLSPWQHFMSKNLIFFTPDCASPPMVNLISILVRWQLSIDCWCGCIAQREHSCFSPSSLGFDSRHSWKMFTWIFWCCLDLLTALLRIKWTEAWKCQSNPSSTDEWHAITTKKKVSQSLAIRLGNLFDQLHLIFFARNSAAHLESPFGSKVIC